MRAPGSQGRSEDEPGRNSDHGFTRKIIPEFRLTGRNLPVYFRCRDGNAKHTQRETEMNANERMLRGGKSSDRIASELRESAWESIPKTRKLPGEIVPGDVVYNGPKSEGIWCTVIGVIPGPEGSGGVKIRFLTETAGEGEMWVMYTGEPFYVRTN